MKGKWKQKSKKNNKGNVVLQKYMVAVEEFIKNKSGSDDVDHKSAFNYIKKKSRKELRKEKRRLKKVKMKSHYEGKKDCSLPPANDETADKQEDLLKKKKNDKQNNDLPDTSSSKLPLKKTEKSKPKKKKINMLQESRKMALLEANEQEDREIKKLERSLGLNKRKNKKSLPQSFVADGLDYILGVLDSGSSAVGLYDSEDDMDMAKENFSKLDKNESQVSDDEDQHEMSSDEDENPKSSDNEDDSHDDDENMDENMVEEEEAGEETEDEENVLHESDGQDEEEEEEMGSEVEDNDDNADVQTTEPNAGVVSPVSYMRDFIFYTVSNAT